jgi:hypothetical protein
MQVIYDMVAKVGATFHAFMKLDGIRFKWIEGQFKGTVFSGHPTRTTLGNTIRVI